MSKSRFHFTTLFLTLLFVLLASCACADWTKDGDHLTYNGLTGMQSISGHNYRFSDEGWLLGNGKVQEIHTYYSDEYVFPSLDGTLQYGWQTVSNEKYYFDETTGYAARRTYARNDAFSVDKISRSIDGKRYFFDSQGKLITASWVIPNSYYSFYASSDGIALSGYQLVEGIYYYFDENGSSQEGFIAINGATHYFSPGSRHPEIRGWGSVNNEWLYFDENTGAMMTGSIMVRGRSYTLGPDGALAVDKAMILYDSDSMIGIDQNGSLLDGWQDLDHNRYYFYNSNAFTGVHEIDSSSYYSYYYYFDQEGRLQTDYWYTEDGKKYYFDENGLRASGWQVIGGYTYYFNPEVFTGHQEIANEHYLFDDDGRLKTNYWEITDEGKYYYESSGIRVYGWMEIDGYTYCFQPAALTGLQSIEESRSEEFYYYFDDEGRMQTDYWYLQDGKKYYFGENGKRASGWTDIGGFTYYFNPEPITGLQHFYGLDWYDINEPNYLYDWTYYYFDTDGRMQTNYWYLQDGKKYYFDETGIRASGWHEIGGFRYYFDPDTHVAYTGMHWIELDNYLTCFYCFDEEGRMQTNHWDTEENKKYYFGADGAHVSGWQEIDGNTYYFSPEDAAAYISCTAGLSRDGHYAFFTFDREGRLIASGEIPSVYDADTETLCVIQDDSGTAIVSFIGPVDSNSESVTVPDTVQYDDYTYNVTIISESAFANSKTLKQIRIGKNIRQISRKAFYNCAALTEVTGGSAIVSIEDEAFEKCTSLTAFTFGSKLKTIGSNAFNGCTALASVSGGKNLTAINQAAFKNCKALTAFNLGKVKTIGKEAFSGCIKLKTVSGGKALTAINQAAFKNCKALTAFDLGKVKTIGIEAFSGCVKLKTVSGGDTVSTLSQAAFKGCKALTAFNLGNKVKTIGKEAFSGCAKLKTVSGGDAVTVISQAAFSGCKSINHFTFGKKVKTIDKQAFFKCSKLSGITVLSTSLKKVGEKAFEGGPKKVKVLCPKKKLKAYQKLFTKAGMSGKSTFTGQ